MFLALLSHALAAPVHGFVDLHMHIAAHIAVPVYGRGPDATPPERLTHKHALRPQIFTEHLTLPGPAVIVSLAYANPFFTAFETRQSMRRRIERQLDYVEAWCVRHAERFGLARSPDEARAIVASGRTAVVHGIEGATKILDGPEDARSWALRGVAVVTPIHLADNAIGGAWCQRGMLHLLNVPGCWREALAPERHGLTGAGPDRIRALVDAGIVVDLAHTSPASFAEAVSILQERGVAPVYTHVAADALRRHPTALTDDEMRQVQALGGLMGITAGLDRLPAGSVPPERRADHCGGSIDDLEVEWNHIVAVTAGEPVAWGSDFQGGVDHQRPKYGPRGCSDGAEAVPLDTFDVAGLAHPGLVEPMFSHLAEAGVDRRPLDASAERFLVLWERAQLGKR